MPKEDLDFEALDLRAILALGEGVDMPDGFREMAELITCLLEISAMQKQALTLEGNTLNMVVRFAAPTMPEDLLLGAKEAVSTAAVLLENIQAKYLECAKIANAAANEWRGQ